MTAPPPIDPRLTVLSGRLARLTDMKAEAALVTAGLVAIADEHDLLPRLLHDIPALPISSAFLAASQSVDELVSTGTRLLDEIEQARLRHAATRTPARPPGAGDVAELEPRPASGGTR
ncbi:hypothetical protein [Lentzea terrae]|uniref:hypothetical protein n=1 Tax=Lentzea terrae TaxID=2200761 RepID=UPI000DD4BC72|nr:hypothetical protein [Lentzea terrae]